MSAVYMICFFFQAEDGIRDVAVTGVQTCALPISTRLLELRAFCLGLVQDWDVGIGVLPKREEVLLVRRYGLWRCRQRLGKRCRAASVLADLSQLGTSESVKCF